MNIEEEDLLQQPFIDPALVESEQEYELVTKKEYDFLVPKPIKYFSPFLYSKSNTVHAGDDKIDAADDDPAPDSIPKYEEYEEEILMEVKRRLREEGYESSISDDSDSENEGDAPASAAPVPAPAPEPAKKVDDDSSDSDSDSDEEDTSKVYQPDSEDEEIIEGVGFTEADMERFAKEKGTHVFATNFHPYRDWIAFGMVTGEVVIFEYSHKGNKLIKAIRLHEEGSIRDLCFSDDGTMLFTVSNDKSIKALKVNDDSWKILWTIEDAHEDPINKLLVCDDNTLATGDDSGHVCIWDVRPSKHRPYNQDRCLAKFDEHADYISGFDYNPDMKLLYATSGDGSMSIYSLKSRDLSCVDVTTNTHHDYTAVCEMKNGEYIVTGTSTGTLLVYRYGCWAEPVSSVVTKYGQIETLCFLTEELVAAGFGDGRARVYQIMPNRLVSVAAIHNVFVPVSHLSLSRDGKFLATTGDDCFVKFWTVYHYFGKRLEDEIDENGDPIPRAAVPESKDGNEEADDEEEDVVSVSMSSSDDEDDEDMDFSDSDSEDVKQPLAKSKKRPLPSDSDSDDSSDEEDKQAAPKKAPSPKKPAVRGPKPKPADFEDSSDEEEDSDAETEKAPQGKDDDGDESAEEIIEPPKIQKSRKPAIQQPPKKKKRTFNSSHKAFMSGLL